MQGALLLVLFQASHVLEHKRTDKAQGNLKSLFNATPEHAVLVELRSDGSPDMTNLTDAKARDIAVGSNMLVRPGEQVPASPCGLLQDVMCTPIHLTMPNSIAYAKPLTGSVFISQALHLLHMHSMPEAARRAHCYQHMRCASESCNWQGLSCSMP